VSTESLVDLDKVSQREDIVHGSIA
jgi:hypothetical protein